VPTIDHTVFIVDDDASVRDSLNLLLGLRGYRTQTFANAETFLKAYSPAWTGCILLDIRMPGMNGLELYAELRRRACAVPVVIITAYGDVATARAALKVGAADFLEKPVDDALLIDVLRNALDSEEARAEAAARGRTAERPRAFTMREQQVMDLTAQGLPARKIAETLGISPRTVEVYRSRIAHKVRRDSSSG
jgi:FixJ family two-component response regulator